MRKEFFEQHFHGRSFTNSLNYYLSSLFFNAFPIPQHEPGALATLRYIGDPANDRWCLLIFPEGKMTRAGEIAPFQPGVGMMASKLGIPVVPIRIEGLDRVLHQTWKMARSGTRQKSNSAPPLRLNWKRRLPRAYAAGGRGGAQPVTRADQGPAPRFQKSSICSLGVGFGLRGVRNGLPTTPKYLDTRERAALGTNMRWFWKPGSGGTTEKPKVSNCKEIVRKNSVHRVAIAEIHPQPQPFQLGPRGEKA